MIEILPVRGIGEVQLGDDLATLLVEAIAAAGIELASDDIVVITHKIVSKAEGAVVRVDPDDPDAHREVAVREAAAILRRRGDLIIAETKHGFVCANAGVDRSNMRPGDVALLPVDPDRSAHTIRKRLESATGLSLAVVITDTFGRPWRRGLTDIAIGVSGMEAVQDLRGQPDMHGRVMEVTEIAIADEVASAADLAMGKASGIPAAIVRGLHPMGPAGRGADLIRPASEDLFR